MAEEINGSLYFQLKLDGREGGGLFTEATGGGSENSVIEQKVSAPNGSVQIRKIPGNLKFNDPTLKRGVDPDMKIDDTDGISRPSRASIPSLASSLRTVRAVKA